MLHITEGIKSQVKWLVEATYNDQITKLESDCTDLDAIAYHPARLDALSYCSWAQSYTE